MSDNAPGDTAKPARKPRKAAPRRGKPAAKATAQTEAPADPLDAEAQANAPQSSHAPAAPTHVPVESKAPAEAKATHATRTPPAAAGKPTTTPAPAPQPGAAPALRVLIRVPLNVRWRDLDAFNHVNNSKYLSYLEEARLQWMLTMPGQGLDDHVAPVVAAATLNYRRPIEWPNEVMVELFVERLGKTSVTIGHRIIAREDASVLYCDGNVVMVWIDRGTGAAAPLPAEVRGACG